MSRSMQRSHAARVVVVIWTTDAAVSRWVYAEASRATQLRKLVNVRPADARGRRLSRCHSTSITSPHRGAQRRRLDRQSTGCGRVNQSRPRIPLYFLYEQHHDRALIGSQSEEPLPTPNAAPSELLQAKYAVVPYADVTGMAVEMVNWCTACPCPTAGRLIHGPGGLGKIRLLAHVAGELRERGWIAGFLNPAHEQSERPRLRNAGRPSTSSSPTSTMPASSSSSTTPRAARTNWLGSPDALSSARGRRPPNPPYLALRAAPASGGSG